MWSGGEVYTSKYNESANRHYMDPALFHPQLRFCDIFRFNILWKDGNTYDRDQPSVMMIR